MELKVYLYLVVSRSGDCTLGNFCHSGFPLLLVLIFFYLIALKYGDM